MIRPFGGKHPRLAEGVFVEDSAQVIGDVSLERTRTSGSGP